MIKLVSEAEEVIAAATGPLSTAGRNQLSVIKQQLDGKLTFLEEMDKNILSSCDPTRIVTKIEEPDAIVSKVCSCKLKIDEFLALMTSVSTTSPPPAVAKPLYHFKTSTTQTRLMEMLQMDYILGLF